MSREDWALESARRDAGDNAEKLLTSIGISVATVLVVVSLRWACSRQGCCLTKESYECDGDWKNLQLNV